MKDKIILFGAGKLAEIFIQGFKQYLEDQYEIIAVYSRRKEPAEKLAANIIRETRSKHCKALTEIHEIYPLKPDYILEMASPSALKEFAIKAFEHRISIVTLSIGALADKEFYKRVNQAGKEHGAKLHIASGAIGGLDVLQTVSLMEPSKGSFHTQKGPNSLKNTKVFTADLLQHEKTVFSGNALEAIQLFPTKVNVAVAASIASIGPDSMEVKIDSTPNYIGDRHTIKIQNEEVSASIDVYSKTASIAAWIVVRALINLQATIVF